MNLIKKQPLGRGLEALIPKGGDSKEKSAGVDRLLDLDIADIIPNDLQPRRIFEPEALSALTESIKSKGIMQPLVVTKSGDKYMLISGERRWRAAGLAGLKSVPAIMFAYPEEAERLELALIENTQRDDLRSMELAKAYELLIKKYGYRQEDVARVAGRSRSSVANILRLLDLLPFVMSALEDGKISEGHARVFLTLDENNCRVLLNSILQNGLSVRETEALAKKLAVAGKPVVQKALSADSEAVRREIETYFGAKVRLKERGSKGTIEIKYESLDDLDRILNKVRGE